MDQRVIRYAVAYSSGQEFAWFTAESDADEFKAHCEENEGLKFKIIDYTGGNK